MTIVLKEMSNQKFEQFLDKLCTQINQAKETPTYKNHVLPIYSEEDHQQLVELINYIATNDDVPCTIAQTYKGGRYTGFDIGFDLDRPCVNDNVLRLLKMKLCQMDGLSHIRTSLIHYPDGTRSKLHRLCFIFER